MTTVIAVDRLTRRFGPRRGVEDVSFEVDEGEIFGFLGPNGAGKSTTIRMLLGLYRRTSGTATVFGLDTATQAARIHRRTGYLPGELTLFPKLTGREHLDRFGKLQGARDRRYRDELVERFGVELDRPVHMLSKGNAQKIGVVLAFGHRPDLLVLDEPTSGLDPLLQDEFVTLVRETTAEGRTVFLSSHDLDEVQRLADRVSIIKEGRLVVTDTVADLRRSAPSTVEFRFDRAVDAGSFADLDGVRVVSSTADGVVLSVAGSVAPLLRVAAELEPVEMSARGADLDELFLGYYRDDSPQEDAHVD
ncbi:ABC transporter ATP-binding protein [Rhodococcus sp. NPDC127528]|uniref:ABC transporter ATP-binding protein n=1 Tax=unclassified Rhodococcus (in: high G+C Gram-positive bacteria) TaxID=192944 RepID=UPI00363547DF